MQPWMLGLFSK